MLTVSNLSKSPNFRATSYDPNQRAQAPQRQQIDPRVYAQIEAQKKQNKREAWSKAGTIAQIGLAAAFVTLAIQAVVKHKYDVNKLKAETQYLIEAKKNMGKGGVDARQDFTDDCVKMWRSIEEALGLDDLILSQSLRTNAQSIHNCIKDPSKLELMGSKPIFSILLYGPPGTGKTTYATAIAKKYPGSKLAFLDVGTMKDMWHGGSEKKISAMIDDICKEADKLLKEYNDELAKVIDPDIVKSGDKVKIAKAIEAAKKAGKTIPEQKRVFVIADEIDSIMMVDNSHGAKLSNDMLNEFKKGFTDKLGRHPNITVFGCTNLPIDVEKGALKGVAKELDTAMLDRFQLKIEVGAPDKEQLLGLVQKTYAKLADTPYISQDLLDGAAGKNPEIAKALDNMCELLAKDPYEREFSFRKLISLIEESPRSMLNQNRPLEFKDLVATMENQKGNFKISDAELEAFKESVKHLL